MSQEEGINLAGIQRILELERRVEALEEERDALRGAVAAAEAKRNRVFAASADGQVMPMRRGQRPWDSSLRPEARSGGSLTVWNPVRALAALASAETPARSALPAAPRSNAHAVMKGRSSLAARTSRHKGLRDPSTGWVPQRNSIEDPGAHRILDRSLEQATGLRLLNIVLPGHDWFR